LIVIEGIRKHVIPLAVAFGRTVPANLLFPLSYSSTLEKSRCPGKLDRIKVQENTVARADPGD
jgi:hypothetical protein